MPSAESGRALRRPRLAITAFLPRFSRYLFSDP